MFAGWPVRLLAALPVGGSLVISFAGLADLARSARITGHLAYIWPLSLDAAGVVASMIWLDQRMPAPARKAARGLALATIVLSVAGNSLQHWLIEHGQRPHVLIQMAVGAVPPMVLFGMLHVLTLAGRRTSQVAEAVSLATDAGQSVPMLVSAAKPVKPASRRIEFQIVWPATATTSRPAPANQVPAIPTTTSQPPMAAPAPASQVDQPARSRPTPQSVRLAGQSPAKSRPASQGEWMVHLDAAREVLVDQPGIGRPALAAALSAASGQHVPDSQARKLLAHLAAEQATTSQSDQPEEVAAA